MRAPEPCPPQPRRRGWPGTALPRLAALVSLAALAAFPAAAQQGDLRARIQADYRVSPAPQGVALEPREPSLGISSILVAGDEVRVNGAKVKEVALRAWLQADAEPILALAALTPADRRRLFDLGLEGLSEPVLEAPAGPQVEAPEAPKPPQPPDAGADEAEAADEEEASDSPSPSHRTGSQFALFNSVTVDRDESARDAVAVFGSVTVDGEVRGDVTSVFGSTWIDGRVEGEVVAVNGWVHLGPNAEVLRDVTSVGGGVERNPGARVRGAVTEVPFGGFSWRDDEEGRGHMWRGPFSGRRWLDPVSGLWSLFWRLTLFGFIAFLLCLTLLVAPRAVERSAERVRQSWWKAGLVGFLALLLFIPFCLLAALLLVITIIGIALIPILVLVLPFAILAVWLVGYSAASLELGRWLGRKLGWAVKSPYAHLLIGFSLLELVRFAGGLGVAAGGFAAGLGLLFLTVGSIIRWIATSVGIGAVLLSRYGRYLEGSATPVVPASPASAPPPAPPTSAAAPQLLPPVAVPPIEPAGDVPPKSDSDPVPPSPS